MPLIPVSWNKESSVQKSSVRDVYFGNSKNTPHSPRLVRGSHGNVAPGAGLKTIAPIKGEIELFKLIKPKNLENMK